MRDLVIELRPTLFTPFLVVVHPLIQLSPPHLDLHNVRFLKKANGEEVYQDLDDAAAAGKALAECWRGDVETDAKDTGSET